MTLIQEYLDTINTKPISQAAVSAASGLRDALKSQIAQAILDNQASLEIRTHGRLAHKIISPCVQVIQNSEQQDGILITFEGKKWEEYIFIYLDGVLLWSNSHCKHVAVSAKTLGIY